MKLDTHLALVARGVSGGRMDALNLSPLPAPTRRAASNRYMPVIAP
jgi:hypothetical protein